MLTSKQSFAIRCKTGCDVRGILDKLNNDDANKVFSLPSFAGREYLIAKGAKHSGNPFIKGDYLNKEYGLIHVYAREQAKKAYEAHKDGERTGYALIKMSAKSGYGKFIKNTYNGCFENGDPEKVITKTFKVQGTGAAFVLMIGNDLNGNCFAAVEYCNIIYKFTNAKDIINDVYGG